MVFPIEAYTSRSCNAFPLMPISTWEASLKPSVICWWCEQYCIPHYLNHLPRIFSQWACLWEMVAGKWPFNIKTIKHRTLATLKAGFELWELMHFVCSQADKVSPGRFSTQSQYVENSNRTLHQKNSIGGNPAAPKAQEFLSLFCLHSQEWQRKEEIRA